MICSSCGTEVLRDATSCPKCGSMIFSGGSVVSEAPQRGSEAAPQGGVLAWIGFFKFVNWCVFLICAAAGALAGKVLGTRAPTYTWQEPSVESEYVVLGLLVGVIVGGIIIAKNMIYAHMARDMHICAERLAAMNTAAPKNRTK